MLLGGRHGKPASPEVWRSVRAGQPMAVCGAGLGDGARPIGGRGAWLGGHERAAVRGRSSPAPTRPPLLPPSLHRGPLTGLPTQQPEEEEKKTRHGSAAAARTTERRARMKPAEEGAHLRKGKCAWGWEKRRLRVAHARNRTRGSAGGGTKRAGEQRCMRSLPKPIRSTCLQMLCKAEAGEVGWKPGRGGGRDPAAAPTSRLRRFPPPPPLSPFGARGSQPGCICTPFPPSSQGCIRRVWGSASLGCPRPN